MLAVVFCYNLADDEFLFRPTTNESSFMNFRLNDLCRPQNNLVENIERLSRPKRRVHAQKLFVTQLLIQRFFFAVVTNQKFDIFIMIVILLNMILMGLEHYEQSDQFPHCISSLLHQFAGLEQQSDQFEYGLYVVNTAFIVIFTLECLLKLYKVRRCPSCPSNAQLH